MCQYNAYLHTHVQIQCVSKYLFANQWVSSDNIDKQNKIGCGTVVVRTPEIDILNPDVGKGVRNSTFNQKHKRFSPV